MAARSSDTGSKPVLATGPHPTNSQGLAAMAMAFTEEVFAASPDGILLIDGETQHAIVFNDTACRQLGFSREEFAALRISDYEATETPEETTRHIQEIFDAGGGEFDAVHRTKTGELRNVHVWVKPLAIDARPVCYAIHRDITAQRQVQNALRDSHKLLEQTGRLAKVGGWRLDLASQTLEWTTEVYAIHEVAPTFRPSVATAIEFYAPEARPLITAAVQTAIDAGQSFDMELPLVTGTGRRIWVRAQGAAERHDGRTTQLYGAFQDVTERRRMDELQHLRIAALNATSNAIVITDRKGTIEWVNPAFTQLTGYTAREAIGKNPREVVKSGKQAPEVYRELWETILAGRTWQGEIINRRKDGSVYSESMAITPITDAVGTITHFVAVKQDVTTRLQLEGQLRQAQKMETVGQLASGIAHDFNNLLTVINGMAELVLARVNKLDPIYADIKDVLDAGRRAAALTQQLLAFSRQQVLQPRVININTVVATSESMLRRLLGEDVELVVAPASDLGNVKADVSQLEQVIANLVVNGSDAMPQGGKLTIETRNVTIDSGYARQVGVTVPPGPYVQLSVTDTGVGMDETVRTRIFEPFFTTKTLGKGTGLGLSTVYGIVKQSNGFIWVYSEVGRGTSFRIYLPMVADAEAALHVTQGDVVPAGTETILLVEDNTEVRKLASRLLQAGGYAVISATNAAEALQLAAQHGAAISLLVTDVVMPQMSGPELAERLAQTAPEMKVLYMSGYTDDRVVRHGISEAEVAFLGKPFTRAALLQKVREILDS
jgi:PAS domain S-box-containing protein